MHRRVLGNDVLEAFVEVIFVSDVGLALLTQLSCLTAGNDVSGQDEFV